MTVPALSAPAQSGLSISQVTDNRAGYTGSSIPRYEKLEIDFQVNNSVAQNLQMPYDAAPPAGIAAGIGITVNAQFTPDNWQTIYTQPAFYFQEFLDETRSGQEWFYPTGRYWWKARFAPHAAGSWQYRLIAQDASGTTQSSAVPFTVVASGNKGFLRVSSRDKRYFEFEDGTYFPGLGYNMNYDHVSWHSPTLNNQSNFQTMATNGIQLIRIWLSQWAIFGSEWNPWNSQDPAEHGVSPPVNAINSTDAYPGSDVSMAVSSARARCMFIGVWKARVAAKRNTSYRVRIRYKTRNLNGPADPNKPYGFVAKTGGWLWDDTNTANRCYNQGVGTNVTPYVSQNTTDWQILEGTIAQGASDFLPNFFLVMENTAQGSAVVDYVWIEENLAGGNHGPNIVPKPWMAHHLYFEQRNSYAFDKVLNLAKANNIYLKTVLLEKGDRLFGGIDFNGVTNIDLQSITNFYGNFRQMTKVRWLQRAWWRYAQARWGSSTNLHSWELLNEGDPYSSRHYALADELGKYMHQFAPNHHMVTTSFWHSFPRTDFWASASYPDIDYADVHQYVPRDTAYTVRVDSTNYQVGAAADYGDSALATYNISNLVGALRPQGPNKPVMRGETGFTATGSEPADMQINNDREGVWLHNLIWGGINPGGVMESYWYETTHIYGRGGDGVDLRPRFRSFADFIRNVPLNNGSYQDAAAGVTNTQLRAWGQKDVANGRAHLWIANKDRTWRNVINGVTPAAASGTVSITGLRASTAYPVEWWNSNGGTVARTETVTTDSSGTLRLDISALTTDIAVKIGNYGPATAPRAPANLRVVP